MGNNLNSNPLFFDTTSNAAAWVAKFKAPVRVRLIQWVDDNGDIVDDSTLVLTINSVTLTAKIQLAANIGPAVVWQIGTFNPGVVVSEFVVTTMATGHLHVWID